MKSKLKKIGFVLLHILQITLIVSGTVYWFNQLVPNGTKPKKYHDELAIGSCEALSGMLSSYSFLESEDGEPDKCVIVMEAGDGIRKRVDIQLDCAPDTMFAIRSIAIIGRERVLRQCIDDMGCRELEGLDSQKCHNMCANQAGVTLGD